MLGINADDVCFSAAKLFFAYGLGNAMTFPMSVGATTVLLPDRPTPQSCFAVLEARAAHPLFRRADALCGDARRSRVHAGERLAAPALVRLRRRGAARACRHRMEEALRRRHPRRRRLDRDVAHLPVQPPRRDQVRHVGHAGAGLRCAPRRRARPRRAGRRDRRTLGPRTVGGGGLLEPAREDAAHLRRRMDAHRRQIHARGGRLLPLLRAHRRHVQGERPVGVAVRGGIGAGEPPARARSGGGAEAGRRRPHQAEGVHRVEGRARATATTCARRSRSTSSSRSACGNIRAGSRSSKRCRRRRPARSSGSS